MNVVNNAQRRQFEIRDGDHLARLTYTLRNGAIELIHTEVPKELEGRGYGRELAHTALEYARAAHLRVIPTCPFVRAYLERHPEYSSLTQPSNA